MARRKLTVTDQDKAEMLRLYVSENFGLSTIGKRFGISATTVGRFLKEQGATIRKRGVRTNKETLTNPVENLEPETFVLEEEVPTFSFSAE